MNDFKRNDRFGDKRSGGGFSKKPFGRPSFGGKPSFGRSGGGFSRPQSQMYPATCAQCGQQTEVPFRPNGQRPVYCRDCFGGKEAAPQRFQAPINDGAQQPTFGRSYQKTPMRAPVSVPAQAAKPDPRIDTILKDIAKLQNTVNQILLGIVVTKAQAGIDASVVKTEKSEKPVKAAKKTVAPKKRK